MSRLAIQIVPFYTVLTILLCCVVGYLLSLRGHPSEWRAILGVIQFGGLWDLAGLVWLGYRAVWPGEAVLTVGFCQAFIALIVFNKPFVTRPR